MSANSTSIQPDCLAWSFFGGDNINILDNYFTIHNELKKYGKNLNKKKELIAISKVDLIRKKKETISELIENKFGSKPIIFSSFSKDGLEDLTALLFSYCTEKND